MATFKGGLGRGLSSLIPEAKAAGTGGGTALLEVAPGQIRPNPRQPRQHFDNAALRELADSITEHGLLQPLVVSALPTSETGIPEFQLIAGERRWQAAKLAQLPRVPVIIKEASPQQSLEMALIENVQRADLNPMEEATAYQQLHQDYGLTHEEIAKRVGKSRVTITNSMRLLSLPGPARHALVDGQISEGHARVLLSLRTEAGQLQLLRQVMERHLSVRQTEDLARRILSGEQNGANHADQNPQTASLERNLQQLLGTKVGLRRTAKGGRLTIYFYSDEELSGLIERFQR
ncbi:MAG TPA: ParB/RepB/Spo0J family partition protein [Chloroflexota bacterium]|nr:ParB/RepB/Spo0J family partition protein [Chloroflexota bacterium]